MTGGTLYQNLDELDNRPGDEGRSTTLGTVEALADRLVEGDPETQPEPAQVEPLPTEERLSQEAAPAPPKRPWWKRLLGNLLEPLPPAGEAVIGSDEAVLEEVWPEEVPPSAPALPVPSAAEGSGVEGPALPVPGVAEESAAEGPVLPVLSAAEGSGVEGSLFAVDDVRELVQEVLARTQEDVDRQAQPELAHEQEERRRALLTGIQEVTDTIYDVIVESVRLEMEALREEQQRTLKDCDRPLRERMEEVDYIRSRVTRTEQEIAQVEEVVTRRMAGAGDALTGLAGRAGVADIRGELARIPQRVRAEVAQAMAAQPKTRSGGLGLWPTLLALVLVAAVGVAGILLPRQTGADARFLIGLATMYQTSGETEEAVQALDEAVEARVDDAETLGHVGEMYRILTEYEKAIQVLERAVEQDPQNEGYRFSLAQSYGSAGQHLEAIAQCEVLVEINPANVWYYAEMGHNYKSLGDYDQALVQYQKALDIDPSLWAAYYFQGDVYRAMERYDEAVGQYQKALEINPDYYWTRLQSGQSYAGKNDQTSAIEQYQAAIGINPDQAEAYYYLGEAYLAQERFEQAVEPYQQAIERNDGYTAAYVGLGKAYVALDDCPNAIVQFAQALGLDANNAEAQEGLEACAGQ